MRRTILLLLLALFVMPLGVSAREIDYFPLDTERAWYFDDGSADKIAGVKKVEFSFNDGQRRGMMSFAVYLFRNYNHQERMFFRHGNRIYEWSEDAARLWYDFGADEGGRWEMAWSRNEDMRIQGDRNRYEGDINDGAFVTLVGKDVTVKTPFGDFVNCFHFKRERPGAADAGYVEEWFAPGVGVVKRVWDSIAGPREQLLVELARPDRPDDMPLRMDVRLDRDIYAHGEDVNIAVTVINGSGEDYTLTFPSAYQVDYMVDRDYVWSSVRDFVQAETTVTIPANGTHTWEFNHTQDEFDIRPGRHMITAKLVGTPLAAGRPFAVVEPKKDIPSGLSFELALEKEEYGTGEDIPFTLTATNSSGEAVVLQLPEKGQVWYSLDGMHRELVFDRLELIEVVIPAGGSHTFEESHTAVRSLLKPGNYRLIVGLPGYGSVAGTEFSVTAEFAYGAVRGVVVGVEPVTETMSIVDPEFITLEGARVALAPEMPRYYHDELSNLPMPGKRLWEAVTDVNGAFVLEDVPLGMFYTVTAGMEGYELYQQTIRTLGDGAELRIVLKPSRPHPVEPLNYKRQLTQHGLAVAFGTGRTVYRPGDAFKAFMKVTNMTEDPVQFTFADDTFLSWELRGRDGGMVLSSGTDAHKHAADAGFMVEIGPKGTHVFETEGRVDDSVKPGAYSIEGTLLFASSTIEGLDAAGLRGYAKVAVASKDAMPKEPERYQVKSESGQMVVDLTERLKTHIDMRMKDGSVQGEVNVAEIRENLHTDRPGKKFLKMIEVDADQQIREAVENAVVRIYYDEFDFGPDFDPRGLVIAHWHESLSADVDSEPSWEELETKVDTVNRYVEAVTTQFSSFALFVPGDVTAVEDGAQPSVFALNQNFPNPFNPSTMIEFSIPEAGLVTLSVYNIMGQEAARLVEGRLPAGAHRMEFDGSSFSSGVYFYRLETANSVLTRKMTMIK